MTVKIITRCKKCENRIIIIEWSQIGKEYICDNCGYSTLDSSKVEREVENGNNSTENKKEQ